MSTPTLAADPGTSPADTSPADTSPADPSSVPTPAAGTDELVTALRALFTCTRKVRSWVSDAGPLTVLGVVAQRGETRVSAVAAALLMDVSTVSRSLAALCREGLVQWRADENDLRSHLVSCTPAGLARLGERRAQLQHELALRLEDWPETEVADLSRLLNRFASSVLTDPIAAPPSPSTAKEPA
jgi:DNA-binding MarR family transcriptional regulator